MKYRLFQYALPTDSDLSDLHSFLEANRVVTVQHQFVQADSGAMLVFLVQAARPSMSSSGKEDKRVALEKGVPVYAVFTNAQLAAIVQQTATQPNDLLAIEGVGSGRVEEHGEWVLAAMAEGK